MACNESLTNRVREFLADLPVIEEKKMFQGVCFMVDEKMCICIRDNDLLCRIGAKQSEVELEKDHCRQMINNGRAMKDFVYVEEERVHSQKELKYWIDLCLLYNKEAKSSKKKKR